MNVLRNDELHLPKNKRERYTQLEERKMWNFFAGELRAGNEDALKKRPILWKQYERMHNTNKKMYGLESHFRKYMITKLHKASISKEDMFLCLRFFQFRLNRQQQRYLEQRFGCDVECQLNGTFRKAHFEYNNRSYSLPTEEEETIMREDDDELGDADDTIRDDDEPERQSDGETNAPPEDEGEGTTTANDGQQNKLETGNPEDDEDDIIMLDHEYDEEEEVPQQQEDEEQEEEEEEAIIRIEVGEEVEEEEEHEEQQQEQNGTENNESQAEKSNQSGQSNGGLEIVENEAEDEQQQQASDRSFDHDHNYTELHGNSTAIIPTDADETWNRSSTTPITSITRPSSSIGYAAQQSSSANDDGNGTTDNSPAPEAEAPKTKTRSSPAKPNVTANSTIVAAVRARNEAKRKAGKLKSNFIKGAIDVFDGNLSPRQFLDPFLVVEGGSKSTYVRGIAWVATDEDNNEPLYANENNRNA